MESVILIHPPVVKPSESPPGLAKLAGSLERHGIPHRVIDLNIEGLHQLLRSPVKGDDRWTSRAIRHLDSHLLKLTSAEGYLNFDRYGRAVKDIDRVLEKSSNRGGIRVSLTDYRDQGLSPVRSRDLLKASECPERNPFFPYFRDRLGEILEPEGSGVVGLSLNYLSQALSTFAIIGFLRREYPLVRIVVGGGLVTSWMKGCGWKNPFRGLIHHMVSGPGEEALLSIVGRDYMGDSAPDYDPLRRNPYLSPGFILPYSASTGCYWRQCSFCPETAEKNPYRPLPPRKVAEAVNALVRKYEPSLLHFLDNAMSPALLRALIEHPPGAPWYGFAKITPHLADEVFCLGLKRSGCAMLELGLESGDQGVLSELKKGIDLAEASRALKTLKSAGVGTYVYLLFGTPPENPSKARKTMEFTARHSGCIDFLNLAIFNMPVQGEDAARFENTDFYEGDLSLYRGFSHPAQWDRGSVRRFLDREFKKEPAIAAILRRSPPFFTSNHAPFFCMAAAS